MKITDVEAILLQGSQISATHDGAAEVTDNGDWQMLVKVSTDEGLTGWSDAETFSQAAIPIINGPGMDGLGFRALRDLLLGQDPLDVERLWDQLYLGSCYYGRRGIGMQCVSAIDCCLWSIRAQAANLPLCQLLGGRRRDRVTAYASTLFRNTPEGNAEAARAYVEQGFHAVKFGWGLFGVDAGLDIEMLSAIREALGPDRHMLIDPGWFFPNREDFWSLRSRAQNVALCERIAPFNPGWVEDFVHPENYEEYAYLRGLGIVPIAAGEQTATTWDFDRFIGMGCVDIIQPDLTRCGGLTVAKRVAQMSETANIDLVPHSWLSDLLHAYSLHLIATLPRAQFLEFNVAQSVLTRGICGGALKLNADGTVSIPDTPGIGVEVDEDFIAAHRVN